MDETLSWTIVDGRAVIIRTVLVDIVIRVMRGPVDCELIDGLFQMRSHAFCDAFSP